MESSSDRTPCAIRVYRKSAFAISRSVSGGRRAYTGELSRMVLSSNAGSRGGVMVMESYRGSSDGMCGEVGEYIAKNGWSSGVDPTNDTS